MRGWTWWPAMHSGSQEGKRTVGCTPSSSRFLAHQQASFCDSILSPVKPENENARQRAACRLPRIESPVPAQRKRIHFIKRCIHPGVRRSHTSASRISRRNKLYNTIPRHRRTDTERTKTLFHPSPSPGSCPIAHSLIAAKR
jgi:hypothetical protein